MKPEVWERDEPNVRKIEAAETIEELLDLTPLAIGAGQTAWNDKIDKFGVEALPAIATRLKRVKEIRDEDLQDRFVDRLISTLRWRGRGAGTDGFV